RAENLHEPYLGCAPRAFKRAAGKFGAGVGRIPILGHAVGSGTPAARGAHFLHHLGKVVDVFEAAIDRGEADISDLVDALEFAHDELTEFFTLDLPLRRRTQLLLDARDRLVDDVAGHWTLAQCELHRRQQLGPVVFSASAAALDDAGHGKFDLLIGREAL